MPWGGAREKRFMGIFLVFHVSLYFKLFSFLFFRAGDDEKR